MILSILHTAHHQVFQHSCVRSSMGCYPHFILAMRRSRGFASTAPDLAPVKTRFPFGYAPEALNLAGDDKSSDHYAKGTPSGLGCPVALRPLVGMWFQVQYPPLVGVLPIFRSRYFSLSVAREYLALRDGPRRFGLTFTC
jgi:hypothetical protein